MYVPYVAVHLPLMRVDNRLYYEKSGVSCCCYSIFQSDTHKIWDSNPTAQVVDLSSTGYGVRPCM